MKKIMFDNLAIEVTRRCNMHCDHCMRGLAQAKDLSIATIHALLDQCASIDSLTFTGGEPTLNLPIIRETLKYCKKHRIPVYSFYLVTNGKKVTTAFLRLMIDWYAYCIECGGDEECSGIAISRDMFHEKVPYHNIALLKALGFYGDEDKTTDFTKVQLLNLGNARALTNVREPVRTDEIEVSCEPDNNLRVQDVSIALTVDGDLLSDCDYEYTDTDALWICRAEDASMIFEKIATNPQFNWKNQTRKKATA